MNIKVPNNAVKYILFQRTELSIYRSKEWLLRFVMNKYLPIYNFAVNLEALLLSNRAKKLFSADMEVEYFNLKEYLPERPENILDIGCGVAGIDVMLTRHYGKEGKKVNFYLLDKTELNKKVFYGLEKTAAYYNSLDIARDFLIANGVSNENIHTQEVTGDPVFPGKQFDLVISLISWGFHYPVETYLEEVYGLLKPGGKLIIDVRKGSGGEKFIEDKFGSKPVVIRDAQKHQRFLIEKK